MITTLLAACVTTATLSPTPSAGPDDAPAPDGPRSIVAAAPLGSPDWTVDCDGGADFETIGDAIDAAWEGQWIAVAPCTYTETVDFEGKSLWIASTGSSADTFLDADNRRAVTADYGTGDGAALVGFTIQNSRDSSVAPIFVDQSALRLQDVVIEDSNGAYAIIYSDGADLELEDVVIDDSNRLGYYGAIMVARGAMIADNLTVDCRTASYATVLSHGSYFIDHSTLSCPGGTAMRVEHATGRVHRSTILDKVTVESEDDHYDDFVIFENVHFQGAISVEYGSLLIRNSFLDGVSLSLNQVYGLYLQADVIAHTVCPITYAYTGTAPEGSDGEDTSEDYEPDPIVDVSYSLFYDNNYEHCDRRTVYSGEDGNLSGDPRFQDEDGGDYHARSGSPMIDAGLPDSAYQDPDGSTNDIGLYGGPRSIGGGW